MMYIDFVCLFHIKTEYCMTKIFFIKKGIYLKKIFLGLSMIMGFSAMYSLILFFRNNDFLLKVRILFKQLTRSDFSMLEAVA